MREGLIELLGETPGIGWSPSAREMVADHLLANGVTVQRWIPASEPPEEPMEYNVMIKGWQVATTLFYSRLHRGWYETTDDDYGTPYPVTYWQPLPKPPKEEA